jgi:hypothetical protein
VGTILVFISVLSVPFVDGFSRWTVLLVVAATVLAVAAVRSSRRRLSPTSHSAPDLHVVDHPLSTPLGQHRTGSPPDDNDDGDEDTDDEPDETDESDSYSQYPAEAIEERRRIARDAERPLTSASASFGASRSQRRPAMPDDTVDIPIYRRGLSARNRGSLRDPTAGAWLLVLTGPWQGRQFRLTTSVIIGRQQKSDIVLPDASISRRHVRIALDGAGFRLNDLGSRTGSFVNGARVQEHPLRDRDHIVLGDTTLLFINATEDGAVPPRESHKRLQEFASIWDELTRAAHDR